jgi:hypothetical protein
MLETAMLCISHHIDPHQRHDSSVCFLFLLEVHNLS